MPAPRRAAPPPGNQVTASLKPAQAVSTPAAQLIAADVGGTHVRVGLIREQAGESDAIEVLAYRKYRCADYPSLSAILADFACDHPPVAECVIATAGVARDDGSVISINLPWPLSTHRIRDDLGFHAVHVVNDFEAVAHAAGHMDASRVLQLTGPAQAAPGPVLIVGPGTGLGAAVWIPAGKHGIVLATEAGQAALAPTTELEIAVLRHLLRERSHVSIEQVLSGPGLLRLYHALCVLRGTTPVHATPDAISAAACDGSDALANETLELFCAFLGSAVGDMALFYGIQGGIHLAGGILPRFGQFIRDSLFVERFLNKGPMAEALQRIPVTLVEHGQLGVIGATRWYRTHRGH